MESHSILQLNQTLRESIYLTNRQKTIPCQDSPGIRFTYNAKVSVPADLLAVMSATNPQVKNSSGTYTFKQHKSILSYLMAIAVGDIAFKATDKRTGVYSVHQASISARLRSDRKFYDTNKPNRNIANIV